MSCSGSGECVTCGDNKCGQLGYRRENLAEGKERQPAIVSGLKGKEVERVACGDLFTIACCKGNNKNYKYIYIRSLISRPLRNFSDFQCATLKNTERPLDTRQTNTTLSH